MFSAFFIVQLLHPYMTTGKTIALNRQTFVGKVMSLLFNMLSRTHQNAIRAVNTKSIMKVKVGSEKVGLKLNIQKTKIIASGPITLWDIKGETVETVSDFIFLSPKSQQMVIAAMKLKDTYSLEEKL